MKKVIFLSSVIILITVGCHTTKNMAKSSSNEPTEAQLTAGKTKFPDMTMDVLKRGRSIYYGACTNCHGAKNINNYTEQEFSGILDKMTPKANLTAEEKDAVWKYAIAVKLASK